MADLFYPAIFNVAKEGGFFVTFPDFPECFTEGDDMDQSYQMSVEALGLAITSRLENNEPLPDPTDFSALVLDKQQRAVIINFDVQAYQRRHNSKSVKKTLTIPEWLNEEALERGLNFSKLLQEALLQKINEN